MGHCAWNKNYLLLLCLPIQSFGSYHHKGWEKREQDYLSRMQLHTAFSKLRTIWKDKADMICNGKINIGIQNEGVQGLLQILHTAHVTRFWSATNHFRMDWGNWYILLKMVRSRNSSDLHMSTDRQISFRAVLRGQGRKRCPGQTRTATSQNGRRELGRGWTGTGWHLPIIELAMCVCMYVSHVLDRKLLERLMLPSPKSQVMFASALSWIGDFFEFLGFIFFKLWRVWWI